jgi:hypothetical protein
VEALDIGSSGECFGDLFPVLSSINPDSLSQLLVLGLGPMPLDLGIVTVMVLCGLILGWASLVKVWVEHLVPNQLLLSLSVGQIIQV